MAESQLPPDEIYESITKDHTKANIQRTNTDQSYKSTKDPALDINLPYRTLSAGADFGEYTVETPGGEIPGPRNGSNGKDYNLVTFVPNDPENPKNWSKAYKWYCTMVVAITCFVVAFASAVITADIAGVVETFNTSTEVALLSISVFVCGFGIGELLEFNPLTTF